VPGDAEGDGLAPTTAPADAEGAGDVLGSGDALGSGDVLASGATLDAAEELEAAGEPDAAGEAVSDGELEAAGELEAPGLGDGWNSARPICSVLISTYDLSPTVAMAAVPGSPCEAMIAWTSADDGVPLAKWISQTVPPVKSIENCRPTLPPVSGVRSMKMKPGMVMARLIR
jgi:hypothetical protein